MSSNATLSATLSSAIWSLWTTPMVPPAPKPDTRAMPMVDFSKRNPSHSRGGSVSSVETMESDTSRTSRASVSSTTTTSSF